MSILGKVDFDEGNRRAAKVEAIKRGASKRGA